MGVCVCNSQAQHPASEKRPQSTEPRPGALSGLNQILLCWAGLSALGMLQGRTMVSAGPPKRSTLLPHKGLCPPCLPLRCCPKALATSCISGCARPLQLTFCFLIRCEAGEF